MPERLYGRGNESILLQTFGRTPELRILDFLLDNPSMDFTKREIMEAIGMTKRTLYAVLPKLEREELVVVSRKIGRARLYKINWGHPVIEGFRKIERGLSLKAAEEERKKRAAALA